MVKQVIRGLRQFAHRLRSRSARRKAPEEVRESLALASEPIGDDVKTLRKTLVCPDDASL